MAGRRLFILYAPPRTGSSHLSWMLHAHPQIVCVNEPFHPSRSERSQFVRQCLDDRAPVFDRTQTTPAAYLHEILEEYPVPEGVCHVGLKHVTDFPVTPKIVDTFLYREDVRRILLVRHPVATAISFFQASQKGGWNTKDRNWRPRSEEALEVPLEFVRNYVAEMEQATALFRDVSHLVVAYHELSFIPSVSVRRCCEHLGVPYTAPEEVTAKYRGWRVDNRALNFHEICRKVEIRDPLLAALPIV